MSAWTCTGTVRGDDHGEVAGRGVDGNHDVGAQGRVQRQLGQVHGSGAAGDLEAAAGLFDAGRRPVGVLEAEPVTVAAPR